MKRRSFLAAGMASLAAPRLAGAQTNGRPSSVLRVIPQADLAVLDPGIALLKPSD